MIRERVDRLPQRLEGLACALHVYRRETGYGPSIRELRDITGTSTTSVIIYNLRKLERLGLASIDYPSDRSARLNYERLVIQSLKGVMTVWERP